MAVLYTVLSSTGRVLTGLVIAFTLAISTGVTIRYFRLFEKLTLPTITLLAPVSPIAWLPVAIFLFGIGNGPAIFMVVVALFFHMVLATITQIDGVNRNFINVARTMGATQAADLCARGDPGDPAGTVHGAAAQPVRRLDGGADRRGDRRGLRPGPGDHAGAQHVQSVAGVLHHRADRRAWVQLRFPAPPGAAAIAVLGAAGGDEWSSGRASRSRSKDAVVCRGVGKTWAAGTARAHEALRDFELDVAPGEFIALLGPSGCGKSTLLYLVAGLEAASARRDLVVRRSGRTPSPERSLIFQETSLFPWLSVWQNVSFGLSLRGVAVAERKEVARRALARVGLSEAMDKRPDELSGGMRQRVAVARALAMRPKVLLMDEPFAALDVQTRAKMQDFLLDVWPASGASVLFVTHHIEEAIALADRVVVFTARPGRVKMVVPVDLKRPRDLFSHEAEALRRELTRLLRDEVDRAFAEQEAIGVE